MAPGVCVTSFRMFMRCSTDFGHFGRGLRLTPIVGTLTVNSWNINGRNFSSKDSSIDKYQDDSSSATGETNIKKVMRPKVDLRKNTTNIENIQVTTTTTPNSTTTTSPTTNKLYSKDAANLMERTVAELKNELRSYGLNINGKKQTLIERLENHLRQLQQQQHKQQHQQHEQQHKQHEQQQHYKHSDEKHKKKNEQTERTINREQQQVTAEDGEKHLSRIADKFYIKAPKSILSSATSNAIISSTSKENEKLEDEKVLSSRSTTNTMRTAVMTISKHKNCEADNKNIAAAPAAGKAAQLSASDDTDESESSDVELNKVNNSRSIENIVGRNFTNSMLPPTRASMMSSQKLGIYKKINHSTTTTTTTTSTSTSLDDGEKESDSTEEEKEETNEKAESKSNCSATSSISSNNNSTGYRDDGDVVVEYIQGLPHLTVPLPSRHEKCRFALKPVSHKVGDLIDMLKSEDRGIDRATILNNSGVRIASTCNIESLMDEPFWLYINDLKYKVVPPKRERIQTEDLNKLGDVRSLVAQLYEALHVGEYHIKKEQELQSKLEDLRYKISPLEEKKTELAMQAERKTNFMSWVGLGLMSVQFGILARLTWWEYSWDIMEPVTYFVTYGTAMAMYAYYCITKTEYNLYDVKDRQYLLFIHKRAKKKNFDVEVYNQLKRQIAEIEYDLRRLRDPINLQLPPHIDRSQQNPTDDEPRTSNGEQTMTTKINTQDKKTKSAFLRLPFLEPKQ